MNRTALPDEWIRSTYSQSNGGECIEWAPRHAQVTGDVLVRDSKDPSGSHLTFSARSFATFINFARGTGV